MKNKLKELNEISKKQMQIRYAFEEKLQSLINEELEIHTVVCYHENIKAFSVFNENRVIDIVFDFENDRIKNNSVTGENNLTGQIIKIVNNLFK
jgi:methionine synthase II (cobalamin-independent)